MFQKIFSFFNLNNPDKNDELKLSGAEKEKKMRKIKEVFADIPSFETKRLLLRRIYDVDYIDMHEYSADSDVTKYLVWRPHTSLAETKNYACGLQKKYKSGKFFDWGLVLKETGKLIGTCGFTSVNLNKNSCEVGYVLSRKYWGRGLMPEALELVMDFAFTYFKFDRVEARFLEGNTKSLRVMQKMGMVLDRVDYNSFNVKGEIKNVHNYYITRDMFEMRKYALNYI